MPDVQRPTPTPGATFDLSGTLALVVGGSRGLGKEIAAALAGCGAELVIASRKPDSCAAAAKEITGRTGQPAWGRACHVGRWTEIDALVDSCYADFGRIDVLVNCAGMSPRYPSLPEVDETLWDKVIAVNLKGPFRTTALVAARMAAGSGGSIINISAIGAWHPDPEALPYVAAKAGLNTMTVGFAREYGPKVRVNAILPGRFATDIAHAWDPDTIAAQTAGIAMRRIGAPFEIAGLAVYLASDAASYTTGALIPVDGGFSSTAGTGAPA